MPELRDVPDSPPPFLGSWRRVYAAVLVYLAGESASCVNGAVIPIYGGGA